MFIGRSEEFQQLNDLLDKAAASLIVCKGRRRIGKSALLENFGQKSKHFIEFQGLAPREAIDNTSQLQNFAEQCAAQFKLPGLSFKNWTEAFAFLAERTAKGRWFILLDEISWLAAHDADFVGKLKIAWDTRLKKNPQLILALCGSVSSWIDKNILNDTDFLGRISLTLHLKELPLDDCGRFWKPALKERISSFEKAKILAVTGGVPRYLEEIDFKKPAEDNIKRLCFSASGILFSEFDKIFNDIFEKRAGKYKEIVKHLVHKKSSFLEICQALKVDANGVITEYLSDLEASGFIARDFIYKFDGKKSKLSRYRIQDNYLRFYLKYIEPNHDKIKKGTFKSVSLSALPEWNAMMGLQFENLILSNTHLLREKLYISSDSVVSESSYFQEKTTKNKGACQIDLLIQTRAHTLYLIETKFRKKIDATVIDEVKRKISVLKRPKYFSVRPVLVYDGELNEDVISEGFFDKVIHFSEFLKDD